MKNDHIHRLAEKLDTARRNRAPIGQISDEENFSRENAYSIQEEGVALRTGRGEVVIGMKMGLTSEEKRRQMNLDSPLYGVLTDKMQINNEGTLSLAPLIHPKIEPEIAFCTHKDIDRPLSFPQEALNHCHKVFACMEILDSRYKQFRYFSMEDVIADNSSSSHFLIGPERTHFSGLSLDSLKMTMKINGKVVREGNSRTISGDPALSLVQLSQLLSQRKQTLPAGSIVLAGAATAAVDLEPDMRIELEVEGLEKVSLNIR